MSNTSKTQRLLTALQAGDNLTAAQIKSRFSIANPGSAVESLRNQGYCIYLNRSARGNKYRMGTPSRELVAAGYRALRAGV